MLDTSTVTLLGRIEDPAYLPDEAVISAITLAELSVGPHVAHSDEERAARQAHLQQAESDFDVLVFDAESARAFGAVAALMMHWSPPAPLPMTCRCTAAIRQTLTRSHAWTYEPSPTRITASHEPVETPCRKALVLNKVRS